MMQKSWSQEIQLANQRLHTLLQDAEADDHQDFRIPFRAAIEEISTALEELRVQAEELHATRQTLEIECERYQDLFNFAPGGYLVTCANGCIQEANHAASLLLKVNSSKLMGKPLAVFIHPKDHPAFRYVLLNQGTSTHITELQFFHSERVIDFPAEVAVSALKDKDGQVISLRWLLRDISDRKRDEEHKQQLELTPHQSEAKLTNILDHAVAAIIRKRIYEDGNWDYDYISKGCKALYGYGVEEFEADKCIWRSRVLPEDLESLLFREQDIVSEKLTSLKKEYRFLHKDGSLRWILTSYVAQRDEANRCWVMTIVDTDISDRKRLELALEASESKLNDILNSAIACIFSFRLYPNGTRKYEYYSKGSEVLYGYTAEEIMAARETDLWFSRVHPDDMQSIITPGWENIFTEKPYKCEFRFQHKDGSWRWISGALTSRRDDAADCWIVIGVDTDITDRKRAEEALEQSENQYRLLFENNPNPMWIYDPETLRFLAANYASVNYYGYSEAEFLSMTIADIRPPEDIPALQEVVTAIRPQSLSYSGEWRHCKKDGTIIDVEITSHVITSAGKQARFVLAKDVTARKQAEKSLRQSEEQLFQIIDNIEDVFFLKSIGTGELLHINRAYEKVFQRSCKSLYQNPNSWLEVIYPEDRDRIWAKVEGELNAETFFDDEYRIVCSDGSIRWLWDRSFPIYNEAGQIYRYAGVSRDITERKQLQLTLQSSEARLKDILNSAIASISSFRLYSDQTWDYEYRSEGCEAIFGYTAEEFMSDKELWRSRVVGQDLQNQVLPTFREIFAGRSGKTEYRFRHKDGSIRWIAETYRSQRDDNANCWVMVAVEIDITDRKILELSLQNSEAKLSDILNSAIATIFSFRFYPDRSRKFEYYSKGCEILFGYTAEELLADGANELWFSRVHPDDLQPILLREEEYFFAEQPVRSDYRFYHKNGSLRWISSMLTSRRDNAADCWIVTGVEIDITDRKRAEFALQQQLQQEQALSRVNQAIRNSLNLETIFSVAGKEIAQLISTDHASVVRYLPEQCCWIHVAEHRGSAQATAMGLSIPDENNPFAERLKQFEIVRVESTQDIDDPINRKMAETHPGAWLLVPLVVNQTLWGSMSLRKSEPFWQEEAVQ